MPSAFDATASMLGYLFQSRYALLDAVQRLSSDNVFTVSIETLDDVVFESQGSATELLQAKHHLNSEVNLTDASSDLWKTLRIWCEGSTAGRWPDDTVFYLLTTGQAASGSIAAYLRRGENRDETKARERLDSVAQSSTSEGNAPAYTAYRALSLSQKAELLGRTVVLDKTPDILGVEEDLRKALWGVVETSRVPDLITRLEGWWFQRVVLHLMDSDKRPILSEELQAELDRTREQFRSDNLPIDDDILLKEIDEDAFSSYLFVDQLRLIDIADRRMLSAMRQYFRAFEHRSRWLRDGFLVAGDLDIYDRKLVEEWELHFNAMVDDLGAEAAEDAMRLAARQLYGWAEREAEVLLRAGCTEPFVTRGSLQLLADKAKVGWHPEFLDRLRLALEES